MNALDSLTISLGVLTLIRFLGMLVFIDLWLAKRETKYIVLLLGWLIVAAGSAWGWYSHTIWGEMENNIFSLLAGLGSFLVGCGALLYFDAIKLRFIYAGFILILLYGLLSFSNLNLGSTPFLGPFPIVGPSPGVIIQVLISLLVTFAALFKRKFFWEFARSSYFWLVGLALLSDGLTIAFGVGIIGPEYLPLGFAGTSFTQIIAIIFFLHLEYSLSTQRIRASEDRYRVLSGRLEEIVTERTRELQETQERLIRQEKLAVLGQMAGGVGHELRNPLGVISNAVYYLKMVIPESDDAVNEYLGLIETNTQDAAQIVTDLLDFARIKSVDRIPSKLSDLLDKLLAKLPPPENIEVRIEIPETLPDSFVDPRHINQVLGNLVTNAYQAMPDGGSLVFAAQVDNGSVSLSITDTGVGIPPEHLDKIFEPLFTTKTNGIGLGLAISKSLLEANGGRIEVDSQIGGGAVFRLYLPVHNGTQ